MGNDVNFQIVKVAVVPTAPFKMKGKEFNLRFIRISEIMKLLSEKQHFQVIVYSEQNPNGYKISGKYNSDKKKKLIPHLREINKQKPIDMLDKQI